MRVMSKPQSLCCGIREIFILSYDRGCSFHALIGKERRYVGVTDEVMTLHELCDAFGISRRTVQGYEKHGLVRATGRNPRGYLLYDLQMQTEIQKVHQFQKFGFQVKEIGPVMMLSKPELRERLAAQQIILEQRGVELDEQLALLTEMIEQLG